MDVQHNLTVVPDPTDVTHSYLLENINGYPTIMQHGPIPNVLLNEVVYDIQQNFKDHFVDEWKRLKNG